MGTANELSGNYSSSFTGEFILAASDIGLTVTEYQHGVILSHVGDNKAKCGVYCFFFELCMGDVSIN